MKSWIRLFLPALFIFSVPHTALAADTAKNESTLDWRNITPKLQGCWDGTGLDGNVSECWLVDSSGRADGMFLLRKEGEPVFAEILVIDDFGEGPQMRLKHVNPDMTGWEDKDDYVRFTLTGTSSDRLDFKGLSLIFDGENKLRAELMMRMKDGVQMVPFDFTRTGRLSRTDVE